MTAAWSEHMRRVPLAEGERVLFLRRWLGREAGETPAAGVAACFLDAKRAYMELRPDLRRLYTTVRDPEGFEYGAFRMFPLPETDAEVGGAAYHTLFIDFGEGSVNAWLTALVGVELGGEEDADATLPEGTVTIMFADIADSTALTERLGDEPFRAQARALDASLRALIGETGGAVVEGKLLGDGLLAVFSSARQAIDCAARSAAACGPSGLALHVGLHAGDVIREGGNVFGGAVNIAARVAAAAAPGEVLVSETVRSLARTSASAAFDDRGQSPQGGGRPPAVVRGAMSDRRCAACGAEVAAGQRFCHERGSSLADGREDPGERRVLTAIFCDIVWLDGHDGVDR